MIDLYTKFTLIVSDSYSYRNLYARIKCNYRKLFSQKTANIIRKKITDNFYAKFLHITYENYNYYCGKSTRNTVS